MHKALLDMYRDILANETQWMLNEIERLSQQDPECVPVSEARRLVTALKNGAQTLLEYENLLPAESYALNTKAANGSIVTLKGLRLSDRRVMNGLHAVVAPVNELITSLGKSSTEGSLAVLLMAGTAPCLLAIDSTGIELERLRIANAEREIANRNLDFGTLADSDAE